MRRKSVAVAMCLGFLLAASVAFAVLLVQEQILNHAGIRTNGEISLWADSACTVPLNTYDWGESFVAGQSATKMVWIKSDANFNLWVGWASTGWTYLDNPSSGATWFYYANGQTISTADFYFQIAWSDGLQWRPTTGSDFSYLKPLNVGQVVSINMILTAGANPHGGATVDFTVVVSSYGTSSG